MCKMCKATRRGMFLKCGITLLAVVIAGCDNSGKDAASDPAAKLRERPVESTAAKTGQMPTDEECRQYAARVEQAVAQGDVAALNAIIDWDALLESATGGIDGTESEAAVFKRGSLEGLSGRGGFAGAILQQIAAGGSYRFLRVAEVDGKKRVRFRLLLPNGAMNYHDLIVVKDPQGQTKAVDVYVYVSAELLSRTIRRPFLALIAQRPKSFFAKLTQSENDYIKHANEWTQMVQASQAGQHQQALDIYAKLPESLRKDKNLLLMRMQAAMQSGNDQAYGEAIADFERFHPNDPCLAMVSIDGHTLRKDYDKAIACIERLNEALGGDPYLACLRANTYVLKGDLDAADRLAREAIAADPTLQDSYWCLVTISLKKKDFDETNRVLGELEKQFQMTFNDFTQIPEYAEYVKSPQYQEWLKTHPPAPQEPVNPAGAAPPQ